MKKITHEEYLKAYEVVERFKYQNKQTVEVSVTYNAQISVTVQVPKKLSNDEIKEELKSGYYDFEQEDREDVKILNMTELIINGYEIEI